MARTIKHIRPIHPGEVLREVLAATVDRRVNGMTKIVCHNSMSVMMTPDRIWPRLGAVRPARWSGWRARTCGANVRLVAQAPPSSASKAARAVLDVHVLQ